MKALFGLLDENRVLGRNLFKSGEPYDKTLFWVLLCLLCFGLVMVYSASAASLSQFDNRHYYLVKQAQYALFGLATALMLMRVPMWRWQRWTKYLLVLTGAAMLAVLFAGTEVNGARRWLSLPLGINFQPSEAVKLMTILYMASFFNRRVDEIADTRKLLFVGVIPIFGAFLVLLTRDLGSAVVVVAIMMALLFLANLPMRRFLAALAVAVLAGVLFIVTSEFRMRRIGVMWQPWKDPTGAGYQGLGSLLSMNNGGLFGTGLGNAIFKRGFLPEAHTDFILAVIGEELGLITVAVVVAVYLWLVWRAFSIGKQARDVQLYFNSYVAVGIGVWVAVQSFINIGVNISLLPNKGLTLPLVSYGGSSLITMTVAFMLLLRVDYETRQVLQGFSVCDPKLSLKQPENQQGNHDESER